MEFQDSGLSQPASPMIQIITATILTEPSTSLAQQKFGGIVPFSSYVHTVETTYSASVLVSILGIVTNSLSLRTFLAMGDVFKDGVSLTFFALTLTDLCVCCMSFSWSVSALCNFIEQHVNKFFRPSPRFQLEVRELFSFPVDLSMVGVYSYIACTVFTMTTSLITTYLAVMRCLCVARPLTFRGSLSPVKTALIFVSFFSFSLLVRVPTLALSDVRVMYNPRLNLSRPARALKNLFYPPCETY